MITLERWKTLSVRDHMGHIASEIMRAKCAVGNRTLCVSVLERALLLIDLSLQDPRWRASALQLLSLRSQVAEAYVGDGKGLEKLYASL